MILLERIMSDALEERDCKVSIGGRTTTNLWFADNIDALAEEEQELGATVQSLDKTCTMCRMKISAEKNKLMTNSANGIQREMKVKGQKIGTVTSFKNIGAIVPDGGSLKDCTDHYSSDKAEANMERSLGSKVKLMRSLSYPYFCMLMSQ